MMKDVESWTDCVRKLVSKNSIFDGVLFEDYLSVALNVRSCSLLTIPAELPEGENLGKRIDESCQRDISELMTETDIKVKRTLISDLRDKLRKAFKEIVYKSDSYRIHIYLAEKLGVKRYEVEIRPTIHEIYFFKEENIKTKLANLMKARQAIREGLFRSRHRLADTSLAVYPEECFPEYIKSMGKLLGYPNCCISRYSDDRISGLVNVEQRASDQIKRIREGSGEPNPLAYLAKGFFPCKPICANAARMGKQIYNTLKNIDPELASRYLTVTRGNLEAVEIFPELIKEHMRKLEKRAQQLRRTPNQH